MHAPSQMNPPNSCHRLEKAGQASGASAMAAAQFESQTAAATNLTTADISNWEIKSIRALKQETQRAAE